MNNHEFIRKRSAILTADVKDFSRLMSRNDVKTVRAINHHRQFMTQQMAQSRGRVVDMAGDSLLAVFNGALAAVNCALDVQERLRAANRRLPRKDRMCFRLGIDLGDVLHQGRQVYGETVNIAARLQALAPAGGIFISGAVYHQVRGQLSQDAAYQGKKRLKNIPRPVRVYALSPESGYCSQECGGNGRVGALRQSVEILVRAAMRLQGDFFNCASNLIRGGATNANTAQ